VVLAACILGFVTGRRLDARSHILNYCIVSFGRAGLIGMVGTVNLSLARRFSDVCERTIRSP
jgi:hypothetical protein